MFDGLRYGKGMGQVVIAKRSPLPPAARMCLRL
jgi:hypothetical protein